jgi:glycosyltransferase involved in cell wall biosynthesis
VVADPAGDRVDISVVIPCLNEAETLDECIRIARRGLEATPGTSEIIVADNGSTDGSQEIARRAGATVVQVSGRGYGSALMGGIAAARGTYVVMGDADLSYDFAEIPRFVAQLRAGHELVQGCRLSSGGGRIMDGAMPLSHRWFGNPVLSWLTRRWFGAPISDVYCGLRAFTKELQQRLGQRCTGMEFATEMVVKASLFGARITEIPITLHPDGRITRAPHLRTLVDGWRTLRLMLLYSPRRLFLLPGALLMFLGCVGYAVALPGVTLGRVTFDAHTLLFASVAMLCGYQSVLFAIFTKTLAVNEGLHPPEAWLDRFYRHATLERGLIVSLIAMVVGLALLLLVLNQWRLAQFARLDYPVTMRLVVPGATLLALGFQTMLSSFFVSMLSIQRRRDD